MCPSRLRGKAVSKGVRGLVFADFVHGINILAKHDDYLQTNEHVVSVKVELTSCSKAQPPRFTGCTCRGPHGSDTVITFISATETECHPTAKLGIGGEASCGGEDSPLDSSFRVCAQPEDPAASLQPMGIFVVK